MFRIVACLSLIAIATNLLADEGPVGRTVTAFKLPDYRGKEHALADFDKAPAVVVAFVGTECPLAKLYGPRLAKLAESYKAKGVAFLAIDSNSQDTLAAIAAYARAHQIEFPVLKDLGNKVADDFGAKRTPTVYVLDAKRVIRYMGRVDDQYGIGFQRDKVGSNDVARALDEVLAGEQVAKAITDVQGCFIGRVRETIADSAITYTKQIAPILNNRCVECHRPGEIAPFSLTSYKDAAAWSETIAEVVREGRMPPWHADPKHGKFLNDRRLTDEERSQIAAWAKAGAPEGNPADMPKPPTFPDTGWQLPRKPDLVVDMRSRPYDVQAEGSVKYQYFIADSGLKEDKWISSVEVQPGNRAVVHHVLVFAVKPGGGMDALEGGVQGFLAAYVPGLRAQPYPEGMAKRIPAGSRLVFQIHYTPNGSKQTDMSRIGFNFVEESKIKFEVRTTSASGRPINIPPGADNHPVEGTRSLANDSQILSFMPHMHLRGKAFMYEAILPGGKKETLLDVPNFDFNWQTSYRLTEPKVLPKGTRIHAVAHYDNSEQNLNNPDPTKTVRWGDQTWNEMMIGYFDVAVLKGKATDDDDDAPKIPAGGVAIPDRVMPFFRAYDKDGNGKLDEKEINALPPGIKKRVMDYIKAN